MCEFTHSLTQFELCYSVLSCLGAMKSHLDIVSTHGLGRADNIEHEN